MPVSRTTSQNGFTLVEAVMCCFIVSMALIPVLHLIGDSAKSKLMQKEQSLALAAARGLMSEIVQCRYTDPDTTTGETRSTWDDVSDYNGLTETTLAQKTGTALAGYTGWKRQVSVRLVTLAAPDTTSATDVGLKCITVTVTSPTNHVYTITSLRSSTDGYECANHTSDTYSRQIDITIDGGASVSTSVNPVNQVP